MSRRPKQPGFAKVSVQKREAVARRVNEMFERLHPDDKRSFIDETLTALVNMTPKKRGKLFAKFVKSEKPSDKDLEIINQLLVVFLHSIKDEYRYHFVSLIFKGLHIARPAEIPTRLQQVRALKWLHFGVSPETHDRLYDDWVKKGSPPHDEYFIKLLGDGQSE